MMSFLKKREKDELGATLLSPAHRIPGPLQAQTGGKKQSKIPWKGHRLLERKSSLETSAFRDM